jgi:hypothetical protein
MMNRLVIVVGAFFSLAFSGVFAQSLGSPSAAWAVEEQSRTARFILDGTMSEEVRSTFKAITPAGAQAMTSIPLSYQEGFQSIELVEAYTLKPDGRKLHVLPDAIQKQSGSFGGSTGLSWPEYRGWQLKYSDVQAGDKTVLHYRLNQLKPFLPGWQTFNWVANHNFAINRLDIEVQSPVDMPLYIDANGLDVTTTQEADLVVRRLRTSVQPQTYDPNAVNTSYRVARFSISTIPTNAQWGNLVAQGFKEKTLLTPAVLQIAAAQTQGRNTEVQKTQALYDWVRKNIRYNAVFLGAGGYVPNDVDFILNKRYGDCKDHVLLLVALLKAVGVEAVPALVNNGADDEISKVALGFNHVIVYIPSLDLYLDPVGAEVPYGQLPFGVRGHPVVLSRVDGSTMAKTPVLLAANNRIESERDFRLGVEGTLKGTLRVSTYGHAAMVAQERLAQIVPGKEASAVRQMLEKAGVLGVGTIRFAPLQRDKAEQSYEVDLEIKNFLLSPDAGSINPNPILPELPVNIASYLGNFIQEKRRFAMPCTPMQIRETFTLRFDPDFKLDRVPKPAQITEDGIRFESNITMSDNTLQGVRELVVAGDSMVCSPARYEKIKTAMRAILKNLRQDLIYQQ